jgi:hypothetical protein
MQLLYLLQSDEPLATTTAVTAATMTLISIWLPTSNQGVGALWSMLVHKATMRSPQVGRQFKQE